MADIIKLIQGDTYTPVYFEIKDEASADTWEKMTPLALYDVETVLLKIKSMAEDRIIAELPCVVVNYDDGIVKIENWITPEGNKVLDCEPGTYKGEIEIDKGIISGTSGERRIQSVYTLLKFKVRPEFK